MGWHRTRRVARRPAMRVDASGRACNPTKGASRTYVRWAALAAAIATLPFRARADSSATRDPRATSALVPLSSKDGAHIGIPDSIPEESEPYFLDPVRGKTPFRPE